MFEVYPNKSQYLTGEKVSFTISSDCPIGTPVILKLSFLNILLKKWEIILNGKNHLEDLPALDTSFGGYGLDVLDENGIFLANTAFDVVDYAGRSLRYGFVCDFTKEDGKSHFDIENLRKYHINLLQFYDWSYRHDSLVSSEENYTDMMGKSICKATVKAKIQIAKQYGMKPMAYGAVYAASTNYANQHPQEIYYNSAGKPFRFIDVFTIMNIGENSSWHTHIINEYCLAVSEMGFSGIHMDTYGFPKTAFSHLLEESERIELKNIFKPLIDHTKEALNPFDSDNYLVFNNVGNWPLTTVIDSSLQAIYIEVWNPYERYHHIKELVTQARTLNPSLPVILAAYLAPFRLEESGKAGNAAYLLMATIVSNGGYHLLLGEENAVLTQGYYSDYSLLSDQQSEKLKCYYDFMIRYMNIFYDNKLLDITMTHIGWDNYEYQCEFTHWSCYGEANKIWVTLRECESLKTIHLINLCGCENDYWNKGKETPVIQTNLTFSVQVDFPVKGVFVASPDKDGISYPLSFTSYQTDKGNFIRFCVDELIIWSLIYILC